MHSNSGILKWKKKKVQICGDEDFDPYAANKANSSSATPNVTSGRRRGSDATPQRRPPSSLFSTSASRAPTDELQSASVSESKPSQSSQQHYSAQVNNNRHVSTQKGSKTTNKQTKKTPTARNTKYQEAAGKQGNNSRTHPHPLTRARTHSRTQTHAGRRPCKTTGPQVSQKIKEAQGGGGGEMSRGSTEQTMF